MFGFDRAGIEKILIQLEEYGEFARKTGYAFVREDSGLNLLGVGSTSYVYEMCDKTNPNKRYAIKVLGLNGKSINSEAVIHSTQIQYSLAEISENIARIIAIWVFKISLDEDGNPADIVNYNAEGYDEFEGIPVQMILQEKLENILIKDKYGNVELTRDDLKNEEGILSFAEQLGRAIFTVHENSFIHRDIKLENIFWDDKTKKYVLGDFGIARYVDDDGAETIAFTDGYGAPEIERKLQESYNAPADIYSFGITLYLLLNDLKFPGSDSYRATMTQYEKDFIVPAPKHASEKLAAIIRKMCSYRAEDRFQSAEEVLMELGRLDGTYTERGFEEDSGSFETETYTEDEDFSTESETEGVTESDSGYEQKQKTFWWEKKESELTYEDKTQRAKAYESYYNEQSAIRLCICAVLIALLYRAFIPGAAVKILALWPRKQVIVGESVVTMWQFWIVPVVLLAESVFQRIKELHVVFGLLTFGAAVYSMIATGIYFPQIVMVIAMLFGIPALTAGVAVGSAAWIILSYTPVLDWFGFLYEYDLGWIVSLCVLALIESFIFFPVGYKRLPFGARMWENIADIRIAVCILAGAVLWALGKFTKVDVPEIVDRLHLLRIGAGMFFILIGFLWRYGYLEDDEEGEASTDESVDE